MKKISTTLLCITVLALGVSGCGVTKQQSAADTTTTDPREGWVVIEQYSLNRGRYTPDITKKCDGTTLLYVSDGRQNGGITAVRDSPECQS